MFEGNNTTEFKKVKTNMTSINYHQISNMMSEQLNVTLCKMQKKLFLEF